MEEQVMWGFLLGLFIGIMPGVIMAFLVASKGLVEQWCSALS
jgi:ABC-type nitrate/sulfonate/bicarbonate transport system permease component